MEKCQYDELRSQQKVHWWFVGKKEIVMDFAETHAGLHENAMKRLKILDVGCGMGLMIDELVKCGEVYGLDMEEEAVQYCNENLISQGYPPNVFKGLLPDEVPFDRDFFDYIFALDVIEHVEDDATALKTLLSLLKPGGSLILTVPALMKLWSYNDELNHHFRRYEKDELVTKVTQAGFKITKCSFYDSYLYVPAYITRSVKNRLNIRKSDVKETTNDSILNKILKRIFVSEKKRLRAGEFKKGVSLIMACKKEQ